MKKKTWGNAVWFLFHTLAYKLKPEYSSEVSVIVGYIVNICNNLPCPDCSDHAMKLLSQVNTKSINTRDSLIHFLFTFHNMVNKKINIPDFSKDSLNIYSRANTKNIVSHFINTMNLNMNNNKLMMDTFRRQNSLSNFVNYIRTNGYKYNA
jgi:hypothetical protein